MEKIFMRSTTIVFLIIFKLINFAASGQWRLQGVVVDSHNRSPISYVHIYIKSIPQLGCVSGQDGRFVLELQNRSAESVILRCLGYKTATIPWDSAWHMTVFSLEPETTILPELVIHSADTLQTFLRRAYTNITRHYAPQDLYMKGLYRETNVLLDRNQFLYFSEATIAFVNPMYAQSRRYGPATVLEGGMDERPDRLEHSRIFFYAGIYAPQRLDFVRRRLEFIQPQHYTDYQYAVSEKFCEDGKWIYKIDFRPKHLGFTRVIFISTKMVYTDRALFRFRPMA